MPQFGDGTFDGMVGALTWLRDQANDTTIAMTYCEQKANETVTALTPLNAVLGEDLYSLDQLAKNLDDLKAFFAKESGPPPVTTISMTESGGSGGSGGGGGGGGGGGASSGPAGETIDETVARAIAGNKNLEDLNHSIVGGSLAEFASFVKAMLDPRNKNNPFAMAQATRWEENLTTLIRKFDMSFDGENFARLIEKALDGAITKNQKKPVLPAPGGTSTGGTTLGFNIRIVNGKPVFDVLPNAPSIKPSNPDYAKLLASGAIPGGW